MSNIDHSDCSQQKINRLSQIKIRAILLLQLLAVKLRFEPLVKPDPAPAVLVRKQLYRGSPVSVPVRGVRAQHRLCQDLHEGTRIRPQWEFYSSQSACCRDHLIPRYASHNDINK